MELIGFAVAQVILLIAGLAVGTACWAVMWWRRRRHPELHTPAGAGEFLLPVVALFYIEFSYIGYGLVEDAMGRDSNVEGIYHYPLVNGYRLVIMDKMPEQADIENEKRPMIEAISEVREFQVSGSVILVTSHRDISGSDWGADKPADQFQMIDAATGSVRTFGSAAELGSAADSLGITLHLQTVQDALSAAASKARPGWLFMPILLLPVLLLGWWHRARERDSARCLSIVQY
jgi:hypothetical protein